MSLSWRSQDVQDKQDRRKRSYKVTKCEKEKKCQEGEPSISNEPVVMECFELRNPKNPRNSRNLLFITFSSSEQFMMVPPNIYLTKIGNTDNLINCQYIPPGYQRIGFLLITNVQEYIIPAFF